MRKLYFSLLLVLSLGAKVLAQEEVVLYQQFNGKYSFTFIGNTMNYAENGLGVPCIIQTSSSAALNLNPEDEIEKAFLYWAGSGEGDLEITLNDNPVQAERVFNLIHTNLVFFAAFADVTEQVQQTGNGTYTVAEFDLSSIIHLYCPNGTNFAGWALVVVYKNEELPYNQLNVYDGFKNVPDELSITLDNLNVVDNVGAKIGFVAWEGDSQISVNETLRINGNIISNPPLNPANNAFNGTNSLTNSSDLYNMDLDVYDIQDNIQIGDSEAYIQLTSGQDLVMISTVVTLLNSQLPDATIAINNIVSECDSDTSEVFYTVYNINSTEALPAGTSISVYVNGVFAFSTQTQTDIPVNGSESGTILITVPEDSVETYEVKLVVDEFQQVIEINEDNNSSNSVSFQLISSPEFNILKDLTSCNTGNNTAVFDFSSYESLVKFNLSDEVTFHHTLEAAENGSNPILNTSSFVATEFPKEIFVRIENDNCYNVTSFFLYIRNCPPTVYNAVSANNDGYNDYFFIDGLYDIFPSFELLIYSRWGKLIWKGNAQSPMWDGKISGNSEAPEGTYYYVLYLNDKDFPKPLTGFLYLTR